MTAALEVGEWSAARPGRTLLPGKTRYPFYRRLGGPQGRSGRAENLVPTGIRSRTVQPVAQSLYRLSYPAHMLSRNIRKENYQSKCVKIPNVLRFILAKYLSFTSDPYIFVTQARTRIIINGTSLPNFRHWTHRHTINSRCFFQRHTGHWSLNA